MKQRRPKPRRLVTVFNHPSFVPNTIARSPVLQLRDERRLPGLGEVLFLTLEDLASIPVGYMNLLCATMLPDTANLNIPLCMRTLAEWTALVKRETETRLYQFRRNPTDYQSSEAYFRILTMITVLQLDLGVKYDPDCIKTPLFRSSREGFIHGLLSLWHVR